MPVHEAVVRVRVCFQGMGDRTFAQSDKQAAGELLLPALHTRAAGPMSGRYLQEEIEMGLLASDMTTVSFGGM